MRLLAPFAFRMRACRASILAMAFFAFGVFAGVPAFADDDPFQMEPSSWMSFDRYKEKPSTWIAPDDLAQAARVPVVAPPPVMPASLPVITQPSRAIVAPVMPGLNKDFDVRVNSTEDDKWVPRPALTNMETTPDIDLQSKGWQDAAKAARKNQDKKQILETDADHPSLDIRMSFLPSLVAQVHKPASAAVKKAEAAPPKISLPAPPPPPVSAADAAACAALDAYKKRQLEAIEGDRKTLAALQNAISSLGLGKQLDFMVGAAGNLNLQAPAPPGAATVTAPTSAKN
jgi:hypothetical protein